MTGSSGLRTVRWMVWDTFRQSLHTRLFWVILAVTAVCVLVCLSIRVTGDLPRTHVDGEVPAYLPKTEAEKIDPKNIEVDNVPVLSGEMSFAFGAVTVPIGKSKVDSVRYIQLMLAGGVADTLGILLVLLWTAGFLPTFLEPNSATVLLAKPAPRWAILLGKYFGVCGFVAVHATLFVAGTWAAVGLATGVWTGEYWLAVPLLIVHFSVFYAVSAFLAVCTRSTVAAAFGTLLFWLVCWVMNFTHHRFTAFPVEGMSGVGHFFLDAGYWLLPKPLDMGGLFYDAMSAEKLSMPMDELRILKERGQSYPEASVAASLGFAAVTLGLAAYEFEQTDY